MAGVKSFSSDIENKLNKLFYMGYVEFERWEILCWFGVEKITKSVWAGLFEQWSSWFDDGDCPAINIVRCDGTTATQKYILIRSDRIQDLTEFSE
ncbi:MULTISPECIES: hypothetical protein [Enterobacteriaceae]|uniref:hypothetical protein n=1 Tax=Enterobacteriaceae TaxID=543 RepID=UPI00132B68B2|nr:hypothetical protein [Escherichia coli]MWC82412.1 hypothetical protein [Escherichia coli]MWF74634.1 hypothetical protein [Escherichia coli]MWF98617.1 hypothetical protein [Escherichia coli]